MKILLLGKIGQLGWELLRTLPTLGEVRALDYPEIDFTNPGEIQKTILEYKPQVVINAAAYTAVDKAETEVEKARSINAVAPGALAEASKQTHAVFFHYSTDYVFDGMNGPYTEDALPNPLGVYAATKLEGEKAVLDADGVSLIFRTAWVYSSRRDSFVTKVLGWSRSQKVLRLVTDQVSNPTWARALAEVTAQLIAQAGKDPWDWFTGVKGLYHLAGGGYTSRKGWAEAILANDPRIEEQIVEQVLPAETTEFPTPARRPLFSALDCSKFERTFHLALPAWETTLKLAMEVV